ncbi:MAG: corrinoid protein [Firmicutes bacterium]|nr:corrinoid protein [Bacillota bacterium]
MTDLAGIGAAIVAGDAQLVVGLVREALDRGASPEELLSREMIPAMEAVGDLFARNEIYVPEMLVSARAMNAALEVIRPGLTARGSPWAGKAVIGTVRGDLHDIGKNLVKMMLEGGGFQVVDLGTDVPPAEFVRAVRAERPTHLCMSALLTTTMRAMRETIEALAAEGLRDRVKVMVGGAPVTPGYAAHIGADGYAPDAGSAVKLAKELLGAS